MEKFNFGLSPCPNDTFAFYGWIAGHIHSEYNIEPLFADIETLNQWALQERLPCTKISFAIWPHIKKHYRLLSCGAALGLGCGPKIVSKSFFPIHELSKMTLAIPGEYTTAHLLTQKLLPTPKHKIFGTYDKMLTMVADAAVIIHETRFTFAQLGFTEIADLGLLWEQKMQLPLPLGAIAVHRSLSDQTVHAIETALRASLEHGWNNPELGKNFILTKAQESSWEVASQHIQLYVTSDTHTLSETGKQAIAALTGTSV